MRYEVWSTETRGVIEQFWSPGNTEQRLSRRVGSISYPLLSAKRMPQAEYRGSSMSPAKAPPDCGMSKYLVVGSVFKVNNSSKPRVQRAPNVCHMWTRTKMRQATEILNA